MNWNPNQTQQWAPPAPPPQPPAAAQWGPPQAPPAPQVGGFAPPAPPAGAPQAMQGFAPPAPQGYGPPGPPGGFAPPQGYGPPNAGNGAGRFGTMTPNLGGNRDPLIPLGDHILQVTEIETPVQGDSGTFIYVHFAIVHSSEPNLVGTTCKFSQNWFPNTQGGKQIAFDAVCRLLVPLQGYGNVADPAKDTRNPQVVAQVTGSCGAWVDEFGWNRPGHINGQSLKGAYVRCVARPGQPKPGKTQVYPKYDFLPAQS